MTIEERMTELHGSVTAALTVAVSLQMSMPEVAAEYGCSRSYIRQLAIRNGVTLPVKSRSEVTTKVMAEKKKNAPTPEPKEPRVRKPYVKREVVGLTSQKARKNMTAAINRGEDYFRTAMIAEQVTRPAPGTPEFINVAAEIMAGRMRA